VTRLAIAVGVGTFALFCLALGSTFAADEVVHSPIRPDGVWRWIFVGAVVGAFLLFLLGLYLLRLQPAPLAAVLVIAAAIQLAPLASPLLLSTDAYGYWESGWIAAVADKSPYDHPPREFLGNPANPHRGAAWNDYPTWYGPVFVAATEAQAELVDTRAGVVRFYKLLGALAMLAVVALTAYCARRKAYAAAFVGWNPLLALHFAGGGHNDAWMIALFLGALAAWRSGRRQFAGVLWVLSIAIKWVPLMWVPLDVLANRTSRTRPPWLGLAVGFGLVSVVATWLFGLSWLDSFLPISDQIGLSSSTSIPFHVASLLDVPTLWVGRGFFLLFLAVYCALLVQAWRGRSRRALATALLLCSVAWLGPWYILWCLPLAAIEEDGAAEALSLGLTAFLLRDVLPVPWIF
jgi:alpha-1,6-mannosyltransferase